MITRATSLAEARSAVAEGATPGAGLTLVMARGADASPPSRVVDLAGVTELAAIRDDGDRLWIGALVTIQNLRDSALVQRVAPALSRMAGEIGSAPLRRLATVGGNIAWGAGDLVPVLLAHHARLSISGVEARIDPDRPPGLIEAVLLPKRSVDVAFAEKAGLRAAFSPTLVTISGTARFGDGRFSGVALAVGGGAERPRRLPQSEAALEDSAPAALDPGLRTALEREIAGGRVDDEAGLRAWVAANLLLDGLREATP